MLLFEMQAAENSTLYYAVALKVKDVKGMISTIKNVY